MMTEPINKIVHDYQARFRKKAFSKPAKCDKVGL